jgi:hypothetical protein
VKSFFGKLCGKILYSVVGFLLVLAWTIAALIVIGIVFSLISAPFVILFGWDAPLASGQTWVYLFTFLFIRNSIVLYRDELDQRRRMTAQAKSRSVSQAALSDLGIHHG